MGTKRRAVTRRGTKTAPAQRRKGVRQRQAEDSDSHQSESDEEEDQPGSSRTHGLGGKQRRKQLVVEDDDLDEDAGLGSSREDAGVKRPSRAAEEAVASAVSPHSAVPSQAGMEGNTDVHAGVSSISDQKALPSPDNAGNGSQPAAGADTVKSICDIQPADDDADQGRSTFSLLDAMLHPDESTSYTASGMAKPLDIPQHGRAAESQPPSHDVTQADSAVVGSGQPLPVLADQQAPAPEAPSSPAGPPVRVKGSLRDKVKAFAALRK